MPEQGAQMSHDTAHTPDLVVIGGGVIGLSIGWRASVRGLRTVVLERDHAGRGTSWHAAGMIAPVSEVAPGEEPLLALGLRSAAMYPDFVAELAQDAGVDGVGYTRCGTLLVARDTDEAEALERERELRESRSLAVQRLRGSEARRLEPALAPGVRLALDLPDDHAVDPRALCAALAQALEHRGGELREGIEVAAVSPDGLLLTNGSRIACGAVVLATGAFGAGLEGVGDPVAVRPVKGQIMRLHDPAGPGLLRRVIRIAGSYIVPRADGRYVIGGTSEERGFDTTVTAGAAFELLQQAGELVPGISELVVDEFTAGIRPGTADNLPAIGPASTERVWWAVGHYRGGVLLAPATAQLVVAMVCGEAVSEVDPLAQAFAPARFATAARRPEGLVAR
jgi:glycine oxidase